ncbi:MAG: hypothetical protein ACJAUY_000651 [Cognaticolwellia sp.]|jgi:hypothetical protein
MAKLIDKLTVQISVESIFQKKLIEVVENIEAEHGIKINQIGFVWMDLPQINSKITKCNIASELLVK